MKLHCVNIAQKYFPGQNNCIDVFLLVMSYDAIKFEKILVSLKSIVVNRRTNWLL